MAQYCRYCAHCFGTCCDLKSVIMSEESVKRTNKCKDFLLNPIDSLGENEKGYHPREKCQKNKIQMKLEV